MTSRVQLVLVLCFRLLLPFVGVALAIVVGGALGLYLVWFGAQLFFGPVFMLLAMGAVPIGAIVGTTFAASTVIKRPQLFWRTVLSIAIVISAHVVTFSALGRIDRPRDFIVEVRGTRKAEYVGIVSVDGEVQRVNGAFPKTFAFKAIRLEFAIALAKPNGEDYVAVEVSVNGGKASDIGDRSRTGVHQRLKSFGWSESVGGTSNYWHQMTPEEVDRLIKDQAMPEGTFPR